MDFELMYAIEQENAQDPILYSTKEGWYASSEGSKYHYLTKSPGIGYRSLCGNLRVYQNDLQLQQDTESNSGDDDCGTCRKLLEKL